MAATQSHALRFADFPATRIAWPGHVPQLMEGAGGHNQSCLPPSLWALSKPHWRQHASRWRGDARHCGHTNGWNGRKLSKKAGSSSREREGMLRAVEADRDGRRNAVQGKMAIAALAEAATGRICRSARWGDIHPFLTLRALVRRRAGARVFAASVGAGV